MSSSWQPGCNLRSAMERINGRLDQVFNIETHHIRWHSHFVPVREARDSVAGRGG